MSFRPDLPHCAACALEMPRAASRCLECFGVLTPPALRRSSAPRRVVRSTARQQGSLRQAPS